MFGVTPLHNFGSGVGGATVQNGRVAVSPLCRFRERASSLAKMALSAQDPGKSVFPFAPAYLENMSINLDHPKPSGETTVRDAITEVADMVMENV
ncbi:elongation factor Ts, mitochondrial-like isoform X2 [Aegilops tauschii subsp. strangulata]|uniref:elongation factor Ts, mitochondrial-like isoform X2 n=1 Tax=Aegilops tauschii subsp. strangulata TaxID=200361 RepID=UPI003CC89B8A